MKAVLLQLAAGFSLLAQSQPFSPAAEFDLNAGLKPHRFGRIVRSYFAATPLGLTLVTIGENDVAITSADLAGRVLHAQSGITAVNAQIYAAVPRPDGCVWLVSAGPYSGRFVTATDIGNALPARPFTGHSPVEPYNNLDLYSPAGDRLTSLRLLSPRLPGLETPIAAANDQLVLRSSAANAQSIHFGTVAGGEFTEQTQVVLSPPVVGAIPLLAPTGELILVDKASGNLLVIDPKTHGSSIVRLAERHSVQSAAIDGDLLYLLSDDAVLRTDRTGQILADYTFTFGGNFKPVSLGVAKNAIYLVDKFGRGEKFEISAPEAPTAH